MLRWAATFFIIAIIAAFFGFGGISAAASDVARLLFFVFIIGFVVMLVAGVATGKRITRV